MNCSRCGAAHEPKDACRPAPAARRSRAARRPSVRPARKLPWVPLSGLVGFIAVVVVWFFFLRTPEPDVLDVSDPFGRKAAAAQKAALKGSPAKAAAAEEKADAGGLVTPFEDGKVFDPDLDTKDILYLFNQTTRSGFHSFETESLNGPLMLALIPMSALPEDAVEHQTEVYRRYRMFTPDHKGRVQEDIPRGQTVMLAIANPTDKPLKIRLRAHFQPSDAAPPFPADGAALRYRFKKGERFCSQVTETEVRSREGADGESPVKLTIEKGAGYRWEVLKVAASEEATLRLQAEFLRIAILAGGKSVLSFDTRLEKPAAPLGPLIDVLLSTPLTLELTARGKLKTVRGIDDFVARLAAKAKEVAPGEADADGGIATTLRDLLNEKNVRELLSLVFIPFPEARVRPEETWEEESRLQLDPVEIGIRTTFTLLRPPSGAALWTVSGRARMKSSSRLPDVDVEMPVGVYEFDLRLDPATGFPSSRRFGHWFELNVVEKEGRKMLSRSSYEVKGYALFWRDP